MKPNDENGKLPTSERPFRVLITYGSDRRQYNCPGVDSKAEEFDYQAEDTVERQVGSKKAEGVMIEVE